MIRGSDLKVVVIIYVSVRAFYAYVWMLSRLSISDFGYQSNDYKDKSREAKEMYSLVIYDGEENL